MKGFNYPAPTGKYKVCINKKAPWQKYSHCRLQISVGKERYEGEKFRALCEWASHRFEHVTLIVSDTLQRHNYRHQLGCNPSAAWKISRMDGDKWLKNNKDALAMLPSKTIIRWDELLEDLQYLDVVTSSLDCALDKTIEDFWKRNPYGDRASFYMHSRHFLLEELSVFTYLFEEPAIDIYAGSWFQELMNVTFPEKDYMAVDYTRNKAA
jgi:tRNA-dependent cyclodipeptide synthase